MAESNQVGSGRGVRPGFAGGVFGLVALGAALGAASLACAQAARGEGAQAEAPPQSVSEVDARTHFRLGKAHYEAGRFAQAAREFETAFAASGRPELLYNVYLSYRDMNRDDKAAEALRNYLSLAPDNPRAEQLRARLHALEETLARRAQRAQAQPTEREGEAQREEPAAVAVEPEVAASSAEPAAADRDGAGGFGERVVPFTLLGLGGAMLIGSAVTGVMTGNTQSDLEQLCPDKVCPTTADADRAEELRDEGRTFSTVTDVLLFGGIATAGAGAAWLLVELVAEGDPEGTTPGGGIITAGCAPARCGVGWHGTF